MKTRQNSKLLQLIAFDKELKEKDTIIIGIDEAGRGPLCGPVVAAAIALPDFSEDMLETFQYLNDSKKFSGNESRREELYEKLMSLKCYYGIAEGSLEDIEKYNIFQTTYRTMYAAYQQLIKQLKPDQKVKVIIDGQKTISSIPKNISQQAVIKGDSQSASIAAASILAKVHRDNLVREMAKEFPQYHWDKNKGYGTKEHIEAIRKYGRCKYHRAGFKIKELDLVEV